MVKIYINYTPDKDYSGKIINSKQEIEALYMIDEAFIEVEEKIKEKIGINLNYDTIIKLR